MQSLAQALSTWEDVLIQLRRMSACWRGTPLSDRDLYTWTEAIVLCALHLADLSTRHDGIGNHRERVAWTKQMVSLDAFEVGSCLSDAVTMLRSVVEPQSYKGFKHSLCERYPFVGVLLSPIRGALTDFLSAPNPRGFTVCYQFLSFLTHLTFQDLDLDLEPEYEEHEAYLRSLSYDPELLAGMNLIMRDWMKEFTLTEENFFPAHGPGSIAEPYRKTHPLDKYRFLGTDPLIDYVFRRYAGIDVTSYFALPPMRWERKSVFVSVPKSIKTRRGISKEPASLMFLQQGVSAALMDYIHRHKFLGRRIDFAHQELNADLAIRSSQTGAFATIDLSAASDTVTTELVKAVFHGTPIYPYLVALRSRTVLLPSGKEMVVAKYAPMGSALCFPVETLIFACAVEYAVRHAPEVVLDNVEYFRVYGDDIIVRCSLFEEVREVLVSLGFVLNATKSFGTPYRFRESCGGEGYDGVDVTPMKISRRFISTRGRLTSNHAAIYEGLIALANEAYVHQFPLLRAWIVRVLLGNSVAPPLFSGTVDCALYSPWPDNYRAPHRYFVGSNSPTWYQRMEVRVAMVSSSQEVKDWDDSLEQARYTETLRLSSRRSGDMFSPEHRISVPRGSSRPKITKRWVEKPTMI